MNRTKRRGVSPTGESRVVCACQALETRRLLSTMVINGGSGNDSWSIEADPGQIYVNGSFVPSSGVTDIQVNGFDGGDSLVIYDSSLPIVFNGGNNNDTLTMSGGDLGNITAQITFNGGAGTDAVTLNDNIENVNTNYNFSSNSFDRNGVGHLVYDSAVEALLLNTGFGDNSIYVNQLFAAPQISVSGNIGSDYMFVDMDGSTGPVTFDGGGGAGVDSLQVSDYNVIGPTSYTIATEGTASSIARSGRSISYSNVESVQFQGGGNASGIYNISSTPAGVPMSILGGTANDTFNFTLCIGGVFKVNGPLNIYGFGGSDTITADASQWTSSALTFYLSQDSISINTPTPLVTYSAIAALTLKGPNTATTSNCNYVVTGTAASITSQTTILAGSGNNAVYIYPHDADGNLTLATGLGVFGQGGTDTVTIDDSASSLPINYNLFYQSGTEDVGGFGSAFIGAFNDVENLTINAGAGDDTFALNSFGSGAALRVNSGDGYDVFDISPTARNLPAAISSMSFFSYDGGAGDDHFDIINDSNTASWTITRTSTTISYSASTGYFVVLNVAHLGYLYASGGTQADQYLIRSTPADNMNNDMYGAGGNDTYTFGNAGLTSGIASYVNVNGFGGNDSIVVDDSADTVGRTVHIDQNFINTVPSDTLFPAAGGDIYGIIVTSGVTGAITVKLGSGADTIYFAPVPTGTYNIQANNPTTAPGDSLTLAFAAATNPVFTPAGAGAGNYTFSNRAQMSYSGIETKAIDSVAPTIVAAQYAYDPPVGIVPSVDIQFSEDVEPGLYNTYFDAYSHNPRATYTYDAATNTVHYTFPGLPGGLLPDGNYSAYISRVTDVAGNLMTPYQATFDFFVLSADANRDSSVDTIDFNILVSNFSQSGETFSQGNFDYDPAGSVDTIDFNLLVANFSKNLAPAGAAASALPLAISGAQSSAPTITPVQLADDLFGQSPIDALI